LLHRYGNGFRCVVGPHTDSDRETTGVQSQQAPLAMPASGNLSHLEIAAKCVGKVDLSWCPALHSNQCEQVQDSCHKVREVAENKTPQTRFESQGAQSISPPPSAAQPQVDAQRFRRNGTEVPNDITIRPYPDGPPRLNLYSLAAGHFRER
jgi:hypothetical protein